MAAFDTAITPKAVTPANTSDTTAFTVGTDSSAQDCSLLIDVSNIGTDAVQVRIGVTPSGGSLAWRVFGLIVNAGDALLRYGPLFLQNGDVVSVGTTVADDAVFSFDGVESS